MKPKITVLMFTLLSMTQYANPLSICESSNGYSENETTSTNDYLELSGKYIVKVVDKLTPERNYPENRIEHNGFVYYSNSDGLFVRQINSTATATKINGFPEYTNIFLDKNFNLIYFGTNSGLSVSVCGGKRANKIHATDGITVDFGAIDANGNFYFGNNGDHAKAEDNMYVLRKNNQRLIRIDGIEPQALGSYTLESVRNPNKIAVDTKNNVYVGAFSSYIYLIESGQTTATKLKDIKSSGGVASIVIDSKDNVYFRTNHALYTMKSNEKNLTKILDLVDDFNYFLSIDDKDDLYFQLASKMYALKSQAVNVTEINLTTRPNANSNNLKNFQVKNKILYFTSTSDGKDTIFKLTRNETRPSQVYATGNSIISLAIDKSENVYFVTYSDDLEKLVPFVLRKNSKIPIEIRGVTGHLSHVFSDNRNNIYFASGNGLHILQEDEVTPFKLRATESQISSFVVDENDNVYFGTDYDGAFVLKAGELEAVKIGGINTKFGSYVEVYGDRRYDVIYLKTGGALYKLNGGEVMVKTISEGFSPEMYLSNCRNDIYYVDESSKILSVKFDDTNSTLVTDVVGQVLFIKSDSFNNLYFITDSKELHFLAANQGTSKIIAKNHKFSSLNVDQNDNVYFSTDDGEVFVFSRGEPGGEFKKVENIYGNLKHFVTNEGDTLFAMSKNDSENGLFLIRNTVEFESIFGNRNLGTIDNSQDETIFHILNYLNRKENYLLSKSKNKIENKTPNSATVVAINGKFKGSFNVTYTVRSENDENVENFDLSELWEKAIFFEYMNRNLYNFRNTKTVEDVSITTDNLRFYPIEVSAHSDSLSSVEFKNICFNKKRVANTSPLPQTIKVPECQYETKETILFQITTGLNRTNGLPSASVLSSDDEKIILNLVNSNDNDQHANHKFVLSDAFDLSNLEKHHREIGLHNFVEDEQEIIVPPKQRVLVNYSVRTFVLETMVNLQQKIKGTLVATIGHNESTETIQVTVKEAMQTLKKFNLLPSEVRINQDNSITFNGKAKLIVKRESEPKIIRNFNEI